ncbi:MAG: hypothetical protein HY975_03540 [Candidatus Kerfeldbacteria bacterium]|nr:hypothetical protein [Candidatus Kerfeldbacteria bacterium]
MKCSIPQVPVVLVIGQSPSVESGINELPRNEEQIQLRHLLEAQKLNIPVGTMTAGFVDTGAQLVNNVELNTRELLSNLAALGYKLVNVNSAPKTTRDGKKYTVVYATFAVNVNPTSTVTDTAAAWVADALNRTYVHTTVWLNPDPQDAATKKNVTVILNSGRLGGGTVEVLEFEVVTPATA